MGIFQRLWNLMFVTTTTESIPEFISWIKRTDKPHVHVSISFCRAKSGDRFWSCQIRFGSSLADWSKVVALRVEGIDVSSGSTWPEKKEIANSLLMHYHLAKPVRLIWSVIPDVSITVEDLYKKKISLLQYLGEYSMI